MAKTSGKLPSRSIKWGVLAGLLVCSGLAYRSYGYKLTSGNILGMKVQSIILKDSETGEVFDANGILVRKDPINNTNNYNRGRTIEYLVSGAKASRIFFSDRQGNPSPIDVRSGSIRFPIQDSSKSIAYRIEACSDDWQVLETWDGKSSSNVFAILSDPWPNLVIKDLPIKKFDPLKEELRVRIVRSGELNSEEAEIKSSNSQTTHFLRGNAEDIVRVEFLHRKYREVSKGFLAFGKKGTFEDQCSPNLPPMIRDIAEPDEKNFGFGVQWTADGRTEDYKMIRTASIDQGNIQPEKRMLRFRVLAASPNPMTSVAVVSENGLTNLGFSRTNDIYKERNEWEFTCLAPPSLRKTDLRITVATAQFDEVLRTQKPRQYDLGTEPAGTAIVEIHRQRRKEELVLSTFWLKVPEKFKSDDVRLFCIDAKGKELLPTSNMTTPTGYIGVQFCMRNPVDNVQGLVLKARPKTSYVIKGVHLYPSNSKR